MSAHAAFTSLGEGYALKTRTTVKISRSDESQGRTSLFASINVPSIAESFEQAYRTQGSATSCLRESLESNMNGYEFSTPGSEDSSWQLRQLCSRKGIPCDEVIVPWILGKLLLIPM